ncbi:MAG: pyrroline-5-carboxylate reductase [Lachnospiraceae bacterium]|nr:pyrroline-5-carboxylate reductase [Lachnospiraceae bacterium]
MKIGFIGLGNMASAMIGGFLKQGIAAPGDLLGSAKTLATRTKMAEKFGITVCETNSQVAAAADVLILAVKPVFLAEVIEEVRRQVRPDTLVISVAAGKTLDFLREAFGDAKVRLVRVMPNTPALVGEGCTGVCFGEGVSQEQQEFALKLMNAFGKAYAVPERLMDTVGAVSGSSPAFVFLFLEALADGAVEGGMPRKQAYEFAAQAVLGSAKLMLETGKHPGELKDMVCSPGGTTIAGVRVLEEQGLRAAVMDAVKATIEKTKLL